MSLSVFNMTANWGLISQKTIDEGHKRAEMNLRGIVAAISWRRDSGLGGSITEFFPVVVHPGVLESPAHQLLALWNYSTEVIQETYCFILTQMNSNSEPGLACLNCGLLRNLFTFRSQLPLNYSGSQFSKLLL